MTWKSPSPTRTKAIRSPWFENLSIRNEANGEAVLCGPLADQAALHGVLIKIRDLGLPLLSVTTVDADEGAHEQP